METGDTGLGLERKFHRPEDGLVVGEGMQLSGYASLFGLPDHGGDVVQRGAYGASLKAMAAEGRAVKMLWQHDPTQPIGIWDEVKEDARGLWVSGRLLPEVARAREAAALIGAGALDGLSIGYRTKRATMDKDGRRLLAEVELWEVSLVTFPMLRQARVQGKAGAEGADPAVAVMEILTAALAEARRGLAGPGRP